MAEKTAKSKKKRALILEKSRELFRAKGYNSVSMQDIVEACAISRGGVYVYFSSVDEIFLAVIEQRNEEKFANTWADAHDAADFEDVLDRYFFRQKERLLNIRHSLSLAMYEYCLSHSGEEYKSFFIGQMNTTRANIIEVLRCYGSVRRRDLEELANHVMFAIEGLTALGLFSGLTSQEVDREFDILRSTIYSVLSQGSYQPAQPQKSQKRQKQSRQPQVQPVQQAPVSAQPASRPAAAPRRQPIQPPPAAPQQPVYQQPYASAYEPVPAPSPMPQQHYTQQPMYPQQPVYQPPYAPEAPPIQPVQRQGQPIPRQSQPVYQPPIEEETHYYEQEQQEQIPVQYEATHPEPRPVRDTARNPGNFQLYTSWLATNREFDSDDTGDDTGYLDLSDDGD